MAYGTLNAGTIAPGSGNTLTIDETVDVRGPTGTGTGSAGVLKLSTSELTVADADQLGRIEFIAPLEASGTDAILVGASIYAEADATFAADNNATDLVFATGASETATERMRITSAGNTTLLGTANNLGTVTAGNLSNTAIVYPTGHMRFLAKSSLTYVATGSVDVMTVANVSTGTFTAGSRILLQWQMGGCQIQGGAATGYGQIHAIGISSSTGTTSHSGLAADSGSFSGTQIVQEIGYNQGPTQSLEGYNCSLLVTPTNGATEATYNVKYYESADQTLAMYRCQLMLWEVF